MRTLEHGLTGMMVDDVQADIIDLLYRCAKHGSVPESYLAAFSTQVSSGLSLTAAYLMADSANM